jgi:hypothetical protein
VVALVVGWIGGAAGLPPASAQIYELPRPDTSEAGSFGVAVAIDGNRAVVGASGTRRCGPNAGAAFVYERDTTARTWRRTARLVPDDCQAGAFFGGTLDLSGDRVIIGASNDFFGQRRSNAAYIFERRDSVWVQVARLVGDTEREEGPFAHAVAIDSDRAAVTTMGSSEGDVGGALYLYRRAPDSTWAQTARLTASAGTTHGVLGTAVALDGRHAAVAASTYFEREPGSVYLFAEDPTGTWRETQRIGGIDDFFISLALEDRRLLVGEARAGGNESGAASLYARAEDGTWSEEAQLRPSVPYQSGAFGSAVSIDGTVALVAGYDEQLGQDTNIDRVVYAFRRRAESAVAWRQEHIIDIGEVAFGADIDHDGDQAIISTVSDAEPGTAYIVRLP